MLTGNAPTSSEWATILLVTEGWLILEVWGKFAGIFFNTRRVNTLRPRQNGRHFPDAIFIWILLNEKSTFHWSLFLGVQLTIFQHWFRQWLGADQATSHYLHQWWLDYRCINASLGLNELTLFGQNNDWVKWMALVRCGWKLRYVIFNTF